MNRAILLVFAHPDDESFGLAGTIARYTDQGILVDLICATRGEKGTRVGVPPEIDTGTAREDELRHAAAIVGIRDIYFLGYTDGELNTVAPAKVRDRVFEIMRRLQPEVVITFGPDGITGHPDHIAIGHAATQAFKKLATERSTRKLYYVTVPASLADPEESGLAVRPEDEVTTVIDITGYVDRKIEAIAAHRSQQDAHDFITELKRDRGEAWVTREYLYLANLKVSTKETDLFQ